MKTEFRRNYEAGWWEYWNGMGWVDGHIKSEAAWEIVWRYWLDKGMLHPYWNSTHDEPIKIGKV